MKEKLLNCGFQELLEKDIPSYTGIDEDDLSSYEYEYEDEDENVYKFGYLSYNKYCIINLNTNNNDAVLRYKDGSSEFIIRYDNKLYIGIWNEGANYIGADDFWGNNSDVFDDFKKEMIKNNISLYYCVNF